VESSSIAVAVLLGLSGAVPAGAEPVRLAQTFAADVIPPYEVFTIIRSAGLRPLGRPQYRGRYYVVHAVAPRGEEVRVVVDAYAARVVSIRPLDRYATPEYGAPPAYRRYESGPPPAPGPRVIEAEPRYLPPAPVPRPHASDPRYGAPQALPDDDDDDYPGQGPDDFDADEDDRTGSLPPRDPSRRSNASRGPQDLPATRSAAVTPPKTPLPRPRPDMQASVTPSAAGVQEPAAAAPETKPEHSKPAEAKAEASKDAAKPDRKTEVAKGEATKTDAPKPGVRIIEIKKSEPRI
jgi:hypothetical protein